MFIHQMSPSWHVFLRWEEKLKTQRKPMQTKEEQAKLNTVSNLSSGLNREVPTLPIAPSLTKFFYQ